MRALLVLLLALSASAQTVSVPGPAIFAGGVFQVCYSNINAQSPKYLNAIKGGVELNSWLKGPGLAAPDYYYTFQTPAVPTGSGCMKVRLSSAALYSGDSLVVGLADFSGGTSTILSTPFTVGKITLTSSYTINPTTGLATITVSWNFESPIKYPPTKSDTIKVWLVTGIPYSGADTPVIQTNGAISGTGSVTWQPIGYKLNVFYFYNNQPDPAATGSKYFTV